ncbi:adenosylcobinamide-phosphate synthase CbiB [Planococcus sp. NCCP-2050]|uniref:adenosylcobinamide-phosphate synthase CbiB n=1 Tax=Planococcus sp. NCCP-2050 TaxID=2944679 RepID=UPI002041BAED|nr:adenosylcobinamide-phosphate synthase CbiB [Planococcus sp. NCCP-2050]GKW45457.1 cobalamin biosynthesis protein CbiB [Planococcus sp. NCCP-2050]
MTAHVLAIALGILIDRIIGDPENWPHPVRWIGSLIMKLTRKLNRAPHAFRNGFLLIALMAGGAFAIAYLIVSLAYEVHGIVGFFVEAVLIAVGLAQKSLKDAAEEVHQPLLRKDFSKAREKLSWIVGRDTGHLNESEITRGVVETVSENTSDGVTAPLFWAFLLGAPGLWMYKAVNTCDSMVGYQNEQFSRFGYASAKLDDVLNFIPSRITGAIILLSTRNKRGLTLRQRFAEWLIDAPKHPSPNSGWLEAATAIQLGIELGGINTYKGVQSVRARMGMPIFKLEAHHIKETVAHMHLAVFWFYILFAGGAMIFEIA